MNKEQIIEMLKRRFEEEHRLFVMVREERHATIDQQEIERLKKLEHFHFNRYHLLEELLQDIEDIE